MKTLHTTFGTLAAIFLAGLTMPVLAQDADAARRQMNKEIEKRFVRSDLMNGLNAKLLVAQTLTSIDSFREELGLTQDQAIEISQKVMQDTHPILLKEPVYKLLQEERDKLRNSPVIISANLFLV